MAEALLLKLFDSSAGTSTGRTTTSTRREADTGGHVDNHGENDDSHGGHTVKQQGSGDQHGGYEDKPGSDLDSSGGYANSSGGHVDGHERLKAALQEKPLRQLQISADMVPPLWVWVHFRQVLQPIPPMCCRGTDR